MLDSYGKETADPECYPNIVLRRGAPDFLLAANQDTMRATLPPASRSVLLPILLQESTWQFQATAKRRLHRQGYDGSDHDVPAHAGMRGLTLTRRVVKLERRLIRAGTGLPTPSNL